MQNYYKNRLNCGKKALEQHMALKAKRPSTNNDDYIKYLQKKVRILSAILDVIDANSQEDICLIFDLLASDLHEIISAYCSDMLNNVSRNDAIDDDIRAAAIKLKDGIELDSEIIKSLKSAQAKAMLDKTIQ